MSGSAMQAQILSPRWMSWFSFIALTLVFPICDIPEGFRYQVAISAHFSSEQNECTFLWYLSQALGPDCSPESGPYTVQDPGL
jgi:hypothetical protein